MRSAVRIKAASGSEQHQESLLCDVLGDIGPTAHVQRETENRSLASAVQQREGVFVAHEQLRQEIFVRRIHAGM